MEHYIVELAIWMLLAFLAGCVIGSVLQGMFGTSALVPVLAGVTPAATPVQPPAATPAVAQPIAATEPEITSPLPLGAVPQAGRMERPKGIAEARGGTPDNLQRISGIGPKNEKVLQALGFFHFDQIAAWTPQQVSWVDEHLKFNGRIGREEWVTQAKLLASGAEDEFKRRFGTGGVKKDPSASD